MSGDRTLSIRPAMEADVPAIYTMIESLAQHLELSHEVVVDEAELHDALFGPQPRAEVILACNGSEIGGFALFYGNYSTFRGQCGLHLEDLYVRPEWRGEGTGRRLLSHLAALTVERGCRRLEWWVMADDERAVAFYDSLGAYAKDEWTVYRLSGEALRRLASEE